MTRPVSRFFRMAALLAALGMIFGWMEVAIPDVHDGHGAEVEEAWASLSHEHAPASPDSPDHPAQSPHTCHCIHAHAPAMPAVADVQPRLNASDLVVSSLERTLASVAPEPHFRPPVA